MRAPLAVITSLLVSPALAFENLIIESTVQYPLEVTGKAPNWSDAQLTPMGGTSALLQSQNSVPNFAGVPNFPAIPNLSSGPNLIALPSAPAIPNLALAPNLSSGPNLFPEPSLSPSSQGAQAKVPGNFSDAQLAMASSNAPQSLSSGPAASGSSTAASAISPAAGTQISAANSGGTPTAVATQTLAAASTIPTPAGTTQTAAVPIISPAIASQTLAAAFTIPTAAGQILAAPIVSPSVATQTLAASILPAAQPLAAFSVASPVSTPPATQSAAESSAFSSLNGRNYARVLSSNGRGNRGVDNSAGFSARNEQNAGSGGGSDIGILERVAAAIDGSLTTDSRGDRSGSGASRSSSVRGAPGPVAGIGLPSLILFAGIAFIVGRNRKCRKQMRLWAHEAGVGGAYEDPRHGQSDWWPRL
jgi:hypothetical protein